MYVCPLILFPTMMATSSAVVMLNGTVSMQFNFDKWQKTGRTHFRNSIADQLNDDDAQNLNFSPANIFVDSTTIISPPDYSPPSSSCSYHVDEPAVDILEIDFRVQFPEIYDSPTDEALIPILSSFNEFLVSSGFSQSLSLVASFCYVTVTIGEPPPSYKYDHTTVSPTPSPTFMTSSPTYDYAAHAEIIESQTMFAKRFSIPIFFAATSLVFMALAIAYHFGFSKEHHSRLNRALTRHKNKYAPKEQLELPSLNDGDGNSDSDDDESFASENPMNNRKSTPGKEDRERRQTVSARSAARSILKADYEQGESAADETLAALRRIKQKKGLAAMSKGVEAKEKQTVGLKGAKLMWYETMTKFIVREQVKAVRVKLEHFARQEQRALFVEGDWIQVNDPDSGQDYFQNVVTGLSSWTDPRLQ